jgi:hypothetical protein
MKALEWVIVIVVVGAGFWFLRDTWQHRHPKPSIHTTSKQDWSEFPDAKPAKSSSPDDPWSRFPDAE